LPNYRVVAAELARDRDAILDVWRRNLPALDKLEEKYSWHFVNNPCGEGLCYLLFCDGHPIGTACVGIRSVLLGASIQRVGVACDLAVDQKHRTLGPAAMLQKAVISSTNQGLRLLYGTPNSKGAAAIRRMGYRPAAEIHRYARVLRVSHYLERKLPLRYFGKIAGGTIDLAQRAAIAMRERLSAQYVVEKVHDFDARFDELWARCKHELPVAVVRDSRYLHWRYADCPLKTYTTLALLTRDRSRLEGYVVYYMHGEHMRITDLLTGSQAEHAHELITGTVLDACARGAASISWQCSLPPRLIALLRQRGFTRRTESACESSTHIQKPGVRVEFGRPLLIWSNLPAEPAVSNLWYFTAGDEA
jgi:Acetyltransferase (GNAT) domain